MTDKPCPANTVELLNDLGGHYGKTLDRESCALLFRAADLISMLQDRVAEMGHENRHLSDRLEQVKAASERNWKEKVVLESRLGDALSELSAPLQGSEYAEDKIDRAIKILTETAVEGRITNCNTQFMPDENDVDRWALCDLPKGHMGPHHEPAVVDEERRSEIGLTAAEDDELQRRLDAADEGQTP